MKKKLLLMLCMLPLCSYAQVPTESFEGAWPPPGWEIYQNDFGTAITWTQLPINATLPAYTGERAAYLDRINLPISTAKDWLVTPEFTVGTGYPAVNFFSRLTQMGNQGSVYKIMLTTNVNAPENLESYVVLQEWSEFEINPSQLEYIERVVNLPAEYIGMTVRLAFYMEGDNGDRWIVDDVSIDNACPSPTNLQATDIFLDSATLTWGAGDALQWDVAVQPMADIFDPTNAVTVTSPEYTVTGLAEGDYTFYVRAHCPDSSVSLWAGPFNFSNIPQYLLTGSVKYDADNDGICNSADILRDVEIQVAEDGQPTYSVYTNTNGQYFITDLPQTGEVTLQPVPPVGFPALPAITQTVVFTEIDSEETIDICLPQPEAVNDISVILTPSGVARPGFSANYTLTILNNGFATLNNATASITFDDVRLDASATPGATVTGDTMNFTIGTMAPYEVVHLPVQFYVLPPPVNNQDDELVFEVVTAIPETDVEPNNNEFTLNQVIVNAYDPNDITVLEGPFIREEQVDDYLHYTIRFQNTGTADAINVRLTNMLDEKLDWTTFQPISSGHDYTVRRTAGELEFMYENIHLPDSTANEAASHGYVTYRIKPKATVGVGDIIANSANIYFDFNPAIVTNTATTEVVANLANNKSYKDDVVVYPNPVNDLLTIQLTQGEVKEIEIFDSNGRLCTTQNNGNTINTQLLTPGLYIVKITTARAVYTRKVIKR